MRIRGSSLSKAESSATQRTRGVQKDGHAVSSAQAHVNLEDSVATGRQNELVSQALQVDAAARSERVHELKSALDSGQYQPDAVEVSRAVVREALTNHNG